MDEMDSSRATAFRSGAMQAALLLALIAVLLSPALKADFLWDDFNQIVASPTIGDLSNIPFYFTHNVVQSAGSEGRGAVGVDTYRPLFMVALAAVYTVNGPDSFWFHLALLAAHLLVCLLLWTLAIRWLESRSAAAVAVLFFAIHPVTAEAYLWASALPEPLAAAGLLAAALILDRCCNERRTGARAWSAAAVAGLVFFAGLLAKEVVLMALPALSLFLVRVRPVRVRFLAPVWIAGAVFLVLRSLALSGLQAAGADGSQRLEALKVYPVLILDGLRAMLTMTPVGIRHLSWEYTSLGWGVSLAAAAVCVALFAGAVALRRTAPLLLTSGLTTGLMLAPIALVATVPGWGGFGRYLYVPLAFTALALAQSTTVLWHWQPRLRWAIALMVAAVLVVETIGLRHALRVYSSQESLARAAIEIFPDGPDGWEWLGNVFLERGELEAALECYKDATERGPELYRPRHNYAAALLYTGKPAAALEQLSILETFHSLPADATNVAVIALIDLGRWDEAAARLVEGLDRDPDDPSLAESAARMLAEHPRPGALRAWLSKELAHPEHRPAAAVINPMLRRSPR
jgi:tetratricopeptide (TPR) repeat protein